MASLKYNHPREHPTTLRKLLASPSLSRPKDWWRAQCAWHDVTAPEKGTIKMLREALESAISRTKEGGIGGGSVLKGVAGGRVVKRGGEKEKGKGKEGIEEKGNAKVIVKAKGKEEEKEPEKRKEKKRVGRTPRTPKTLVPPKNPATMRRSSGCTPRVPDIKEKVTIDVDRETTADKEQDNDALEQDPEAMDFEMEYETEYREQIKMLNGEGKVDESVRRRRESLFWGISD